MPVDIKRSDFPDDFSWGTATASYQNEGATDVEGRGTSIWDVFARSHGTINDGSTGDIADDHFHRFREDVALMADLGVNSYRFSIAWPRIQATGSGAANHNGIDFYRRLSEELLGKGITPWATLYHWDLPQTLEDAGGWLVRDTAYRFADYAGSVGEGLGDVIQNWITLNEPWCSSFLGYGNGHHAPGKRVGALAGHAAHHLNLAHGLGVRALRETTSGRVGVTLNLSPVVAATDAPEDLGAANRIDGLSNRIFLDPILTGSYPQDVVDDLGLGEWLEPQIEQDLATISAPLDFIGINYYFRYTVGAKREFTTPSLEFPTAEPVQFFSSEAPRTQMGWPVTPDGIIEVARMVHERQPELPIAITETGAAYADFVDDGAVHDEARREYLQTHFDACRRALAEGIPMIGFFIWTLMDNWEWAWGFSRRFGLIRVDYDTQKRTVKDSGKWLTRFLHGSTGQDN